MKANPPPHTRLPQSIQQNKDLSGVLDEMNFNMFLLWQKLGGGADFIEDAINDTVFSDEISGVDVNEVAQDYQDDFIHHEPRSVLNAVSVDSWYTMVSYDFVNVTSNATVLFPAYPDEGDMVVIRNSDGSRVKLNGNGRDINGSSDGVLQQKGTAIEFYYFIKTNEWFAK